MAVNYSTAVKNYRLQVTADVMMGLVPAPSTGTSGIAYLVLGTSALSGSTGIIAEVPLRVPVATVAGGALTLSGMPTTANCTATGILALAEIRDPSGITLVSGLTVGMSGTNIIVFPDTSVEIGQSVQITSGVITHG
jgi:hypothetical protein